MAGLRRVSKRNDAVEIDDRLGPLGPRSSGAHSPRHGIGNPQHRFLMGTQVVVAQPSRSDTGPDCLSDQSPIGSVLRRLPALDDEAASACRAEIGKQGFQGPRSRDSFLPLGRVHPCLYRKVAHLPQQDTTPLGSFGAEVQSALTREQHPSQGASDLHEIPRNQYRGHHQIGTALGLIDKCVHHSPAACRRSPASGPMWRLVSVDDGSTLTPRPRTDREAASPMCRR